MTDWITLDELIEEASKRYVTMGGGITPESIVKQVLYVLRKLEERNNADGE